MRTRYITFVAGCLLTLLAAASVVAATNDTNSFGRPVRYLDVGSMPYYSYIYTSDTQVCQPPTTPTSKCTVIPDVSVRTVITEPNVSKIELPRYATNSLLCFSITPTITTWYENFTLNKIRAQTDVRTDATIESPVLANPALINPTTGEPFNGKITALSLTKFSELFSVAGPDSIYRTSVNSRECIGGLITLSSLQNTYGLTAAQARAVFANPITVTLGFRAWSMNSTNLEIQLGFRLYGD